MDKWIKVLSDLSKTVLGGPGSTQEYAILLAVAIAALVLGMYFIGSAMRIANLGILRRLLALAFGIIFLMSIWISVQAYIMPLVKSAALHTPLMFGLPIIAGLLVVIPVQQLIFRCSYVSALVTFVSSLALAALCITLTHAVFSAITDGEKESMAIRKHKNTTNSFIDSK
jgi:hypothetical protein